MGGPGVGPGRASQQSPCFSGPGPPVVSLLLLGPCQGAVGITGAEVCSLAPLSLGLRFPFCKVGTVLFGVPGRQDRAQDT